MAWFGWGRGRRAPEEMSAKESAFMAAVTRMWPKLQPMWSDWNAETFYRQGYRKNPYVYAAVRQVSRGFAQVPYTVTRASSLRGGQRQEMPDHPMLKLLARPNPLYSTNLLLEAYQAYKMLTGDTYIEMPSVGSRPPVELWNAASHRMRPLNGDGSNPEGGYEYMVGGEVVRVIEPGWVLHSRTFSPDDDYHGMPPILAAMSSADVINAAHAWHAATLQNSARPSGILTVKADKNTGVMANIDALREQLVGWMGRHNVGKPAVVGVPQGADVNWAQTSLDAVELSYLGGVALNARQVGIVFGVPPVLLGDVEGSTYSNVTEARKVMWEDTVVPEVLAFASDWNNKVAPRWGDGLLLTPVFDGIKALQENQETQAKWVTIGFKGGILKQNEAREVMGFEATPGGDRYAYEIDGLGKAVVQSTVVDDGAPAALPPAEEPPQGKAKGLRLVG